MKHTLPLALAASLATVSLAQNTTLPFAACMLPCDVAALTAVGCSATDNLCHCEKAPETFSVLVPCVLNNSTCGSAAKADLISFGKFAASTCVPYNITIPEIWEYFPMNGTEGNSTCPYEGGANSTATANGTGVVTATPVPTVYEGAAAGRGGVVGEVGGMVAIAAAVGLILGL